MKTPADPVFPERRGFLRAFQRFWLSFEIQLAQT